jgi:hypothetical protein
MYICARKLNRDFASINPRFCPFYFSQIQVLEHDTSKYNTVLTGMTKSAYFCVLFAQNKTALARPEQQLISTLLLPRTISLAG